MSGTAFTKLGSNSPSRGIVPLFVLAHFAHHLLTAILVPLLPLIRSDFGLDYTQSGLVVSSFNLTYGVAHLPAGWLTDRIGPRLMVTVSICGVALAGLLIGISHSYILLVAFLMLMGVLGGGYHPASPATISASVEPRKWGQALGLHMIGGSASFFLAPLAAAAIATVWGWRGAYIALAIPTVAFGLFFYRILGQRKTARQAGREASASPVDAAVRRRQLRRLAVLIALTAFTQAVTASVRAFIPLMLVDHFGIGTATAAASISLIYSTGLWAGPLGGYLSDRWGRVPLIMAVSFIIGPIIFLLNVTPYGLGLGALLVAFGMVMYVYAPTLQAYIIDQTHERNRSMVLGIYFFGTQEAGGVFTPGVGYLIDHLGFSSSITISAVAVFVAAAVSFLVLWSLRDRPVPGQYPQG